MTFVLSAFLHVNAEELKNGSAFTLDAVPELLTAKAPPKVPVRFSLEENPTTGYQWEIEYNKSECEVRTEWREPRRDLMGAKFSFGTNNFDPRPKDLSRWLEVIVWLDLKGDDIWQPKSR